MILIKRYSNRKLYNTNTKKYITLDGVADLVKQGEEIRVMHNDTDEDLTTLTLSQIVYERERKKNSLLPKSLLTNIIQKNTMVDFAKKTFHSLTEVVSPHEAKEEVEPIESRVPSPQISETEGNELKEVFSSLWHKNVERLNHVIDHRMQSVFHTFHVPTKSDLERVENLIQLLDQKVDMLLSNQARFEAELKKQNTKSSLKESYQD